MDLVVVGAGYVGLVTGACLAEMGNTVTCVDIDESKINSLKNGVVPIYEPGLETLVMSNLEQGRLKFSSSIEAAVKEAAVYFIAVGTPPNDDGSADLKYVLSVASEIGKYMLADYSVIVDKSTVPVGTAEKVSKTIEIELGKRGVDYRYDIVSNPEFLNEGGAIENFMRPDRIVIGSDSEKATQIMRELYAPFTRNHDRSVIMSVRDAEMTKYVANAMLATKISFMNEMANLCEKLDVDVENVRLGIGSDKRIGYHYIYSGCGYGGSCLPKDVNALINIAKKNAIDPLVLNAVALRNVKQKNRLFDKIQDYFNGDLQEKSFCIWGLSFKPGTDDMREATSVVLINKLIEAGATIRAYDPISRETAKEEFEEEWLSKNIVSLVDNQYDALEGCDSLILVTEWKPFRNPDFERMKKLMKNPVIFDGRNQYDPEHMRELDFEYMGIGRKS